MLSEEYGGRVELAKAYYKALTASVKNHFKGNGVIASMEHCNDFMFLGTEAITLGRVGDDFWCTDPSGDPNGTFWLQGCHMVHCAYNSLWMGNFIHPDWDMFQSTHPCAEFHAASRAISGGPIYYTGVLGLFNCQGGGWCPQSRRNKSASQFSHLVACVTNPKDIEWNSGKHPISTKGVDIFAIYMLKEKKLKLLKSSETLEISLEPFCYELLIVSPVTVLPKQIIQFVPIGLVNMLNCGGASQAVEFDDDENLVRVGVG